MHKRKLNWLDITLIAVVILALAAGAWYFTRGDQVIASQQTEYVITLRFTRETAHPTDYYEVGDQLFQTNKTLIGEILSMTECDLVDEEYNPVTGEYDRVVDPLRKQIEMKVRATGEIKNGILIVNGEELYVGQKFYPQGLSTRSTMDIWNVEEAAVK